MYQLKNQLKMLFSQYYQVHCTMCHSIHVHTLMGFVNMFLSIIVSKFVLLLFLSVNCPPSSLQQSQNLLMMY